VIMNLVTNAAESIGADAQGKITIIADLIEASKEELQSRFIDEERESGPYILFEVIDSGCGMDGATMGRMFDPFFTTKFTGRGLGMSAVLGIVRSHEGVIQVESRPGEGSRFRVLLPVSGRIALVPEGEGAVTAMDAGTAATVLVIDDEVMVLSVVERLLNKLGCKVIKAVDGEQGFAAFEQHRHEIALVLLDMTMPKMDGRQTLEKLHAIDASLPVVICSGYSHENVSSKFKGVQPSGFMQKPFTLKALNEVLVTHVKSGSDA